MSFADDVWRLECHAAAAPDFSQRFTGTFDEEAGTITGRWESSSDGSIWVRDFDLTYRRLPEEEL